VVGRSSDIVVVDVYGLLAAWCYLGRHEISIDHARRRGNYAGLRLHHPSLIKLSDECLNGDVLQIARQRGNVLASRRDQLYTDSSVIESSQESNFR